MAESGVSPCCPTLHGSVNDFSKLKEEELSQADDAPLEGIVWRKIDRRVLPLCTIFFLLAALDRSSIGNARVAGLQTSLGLSNYQFAVALTVTCGYYFLYITSQFPATLLLKYVGPNHMLPAIVILWGIITVSQGLISDYSELLACRFFLGLVEGGLPPCIVLYLSFFYPRRRLQIRIAVFFSAASLANAFSGLLAAAIDQLNGKAGKPGWAWIFILACIFTVVVGVVSFYLLPRSPQTASFLTEKERTYVISTLKQAGSVSEDDDKDSFSWTEVVRAFKSPHVLVLAVMSFLSGALLIGLAYFEPTIVAGLGFAGNHAQLMSVPPYAVTFVLSIISAFVSDHFQCRGYVVILCSLLQVIGFSIFYASRSNHVRYVSLFFSVTGAFCTVPAQNAWLTNNSAPHTRRATAVAVAFIMAELGGILSTWLLGFISPAPNYTTATIGLIVMAICMVIFPSINLAYLWRENRLKAERRQRMRREDEPDGLGDRSAWFIYSL
ncbi:major facilitator superfamily domain-containing protein [Boletus edulis BED1]|uniref:Major facilitator superfamily domain-containing protein n=1 Tax=Boletus edulis BED1 TaxID=1328754 RepID=A0AAD4BM25_BOLED|nr:major facilitator superfamily domain-containing protein [Boletus edulis BED1]